jgi:hypothetical protein
VSLERNAVTVESLEHVRVKVVLTAPLEDEDDSQDQQTDRQSPEAVLVIREAESGTERRTPIRLLAP